MKRPKKFMSLSPQQAKTISLKPWPLRKSINLSCNNFSFFHFFPSFLSPYQNSRNQIKKQLSSHVGHEIVIIKSRQKQTKIHNLFFLFFHFFQFWKIYSLCESIFLHKFTYIFLYFPTLCLIWLYHCICIYEFCAKYSFHFVSNMVYMIYCAFS